MRDLGTKGNTLSLFEVDDPGNVERIVVAYAAGREVLDDIGYLVFDGVGFAALGIKIKDMTGRAPDDVVVALHRNLEELTASRLAGLAALMFQGRRDEIPAKRLKGLLNDGLSARRLDHQKMHPKLLSQL